jgi:putative transposase
LTPGIRETTHAFLARAVCQCDCELYRVGGMADHVHLAVRLSRTLSVADLVKEVKTAPSKWAKTQDAALQPFVWLQGDGAFSVGMSQKNPLFHYNDAQEEHHRTHTFQDEYRTLLKNNIDDDERYVWGLPAAVIMNKELTSFNESPQISNPPLPIFI